MAAFPAGYSSPEKGVVEVHGMAGGIIDVYKRQIQMSPIAFIKLMLPYSAVSLLFLLSCTTVAAKHSGIAVRDVAGALQEEDAGQETAGWRRYLPDVYKRQDL